MKNQPMKSKIWLSSPHMGEKERGYVNQAFDTNWVAPLGPHVDGFEQDIANYLKNGVSVAALSSGTAAIHLALILLGIQRDDIVICQSFTFSASANPIIYQGAIPFFVDSEPDTWNISPYYLEEAINICIKAGKIPKAIIAVHLYGMPFKVEEVLSISRKYNIPVIEDAAEALGSVYKGIPAGTLGEFGILSFNGNKIITTSGGGALVAKDDEQIRKARFLATQARDKAAHYEHSYIGYNYRMSNICAGIGRGQIEVLPERIQQRRSNFEIYKKALNNCRGIIFLDEQPSFFSNRWLTTVIVDPSLSGGITREDIRLKLASENIESRPLWKPMHIQPVFKSYQFCGNGISEKLFEQGLCLPSGSNLTHDDLNRVINVIRNLLKCV